MVGRVEEIIRRLRISTQTFCCVAGLSPAAWSRIVHGQCQLSGPESARLMRLATELDELAKSAEPFDLPLRNAESIRTLLESMREGIVWTTAVSDIEVIGQ